MKRRSLRWAGLLLVAAALLAALELHLRARLEASGDLGVRGYRGPPVSVERHPRGVRIVVVGDDSAYGAALPEEHTWPRVLELSFATDGLATRVEVVNAAERSADAERVLALLQGGLLERQPTWLVASLGPEDVVRALEREQPPPWWTQSALWRACTGAHEATLEQRLARLDPIPRERLERLRRELAFDFGVTLAKLSEAASARRVHVLLVAPGWPLAERAPDHVAASAECEPRVAARVLHAALAEELERIAAGVGAAFLDARPAARGDVAELELGLRTSALVHHALRIRMR